MKDKHFPIADHACIRHIHFIFDRLLRKIPGDLSLWLKYVTFQMETRAQKALSKAFARSRSVSSSRCLVCALHCLWLFLSGVRLLVFVASGAVCSMLRLHPTKPLVWIKAANWEFFANNNINNARILLQRGLRLDASPSSSSSSLHKGRRNSNKAHPLWIAFFVLEMRYLLKLRMRRKALGLSETPSANSTCTICPDADEKDSSFSAPQRTGDVGVGAGEGGDLMEEEVNQQLTPGATHVEAQDNQNPFVTQGDLIPFIDPSSSSSSSSTPSSAETAVSPSATPQSALFRGAVLRVVYQNAIRAMPRDLDFRLFLFSLLNPSTSRLLPSLSSSSSSSLTSAAARLRSLQASVRSLLTDGSLDGLRDEIEQVRFRDFIITLTPSLRAQAHLFLFLDLVLSPPLSTFA